MTETAWISLADYSLKHKVSISTLRRRIKNQDVEFQLEDGKYLLLDTPVGTAPPQPRRSASGEPSFAAPPPPKKIPVGPLSQPVVTAAPLATVSQVSSDRGDIQLLVTELKKAYSIILQEKDEQVLQLREEIIDLKTLVKVLEDENDRLKGVIKDSSSLDHWLKSSDSK